MAKTESKKTGLRALVVKPDDEIPTEVIAKSIVEIAEGFRKLRTGRLNDRALVLLIQKAAGDTISQREVKAVLEGIDGLEKAFLRDRK